MFRDGTQQRGGNHPSDQDDRMLPYQPPLPVRVNTSSWASLHKLLKYGFAALGVVAFGNRDMTGACICFGAAFFKGLGELNLGGDSRLDRVDREIRIPFLLCAFGMALFGRKLAHYIDTMPFGDKPGDGFGHSAR